MGDAVPRHDVLTFDLPCTACAYNLQTLSLDRPCPECGRPVAASVAAHVARLQAYLANPEVLARKPRPGIRSICFGALFAVISHLAVVAYALLPGDRTFRGPSNADAAFAIAAFASLLALLALWLQGRAMSRWYRVYVVGAVAIAVADVVVFFAWQASSDRLGPPRPDRLAFPLVIVGLLGCLDRSRCLGRWLTAEGLRWIGVPFRVAGFVQALVLAFASALLLSLATGRGDADVGRSAADAFAAFPTATNGWPLAAHMAVERLAVGFSPSLELYWALAFVAFQLIVFLGDAAVLLRSRATLRRPLLSPEEHLLAQLLPLGSASSP